MKRGKAKIVSGESLDTLVICGGNKLSTAILNFEPKTSDVRLPNREKFSSGSLKWSHKSIDLIDAGS